MVSKLRKRVVIYTMIAVFLVLLLLMGVVNAANYIEKDRLATEMLEFLAENGGRFPGLIEGGTPDGSPWGGRPDEYGAGSDEQDSGPDSQGSQGGKEGQGANQGGGKRDEGGRDDGPGPDGDFDGEPWMMRPGMTAETPYETRFFTVDLKSDGTINTINTGRIAAIDSSEAAEMVVKAEARGKTTGYDGNYKYIVQEKDGGKTYIFVDCTRDIESVKSFLKISLLVSLAGFLAIGFLVILLSPRMIKPIAESYEKQKEFITNAGHELKTPMTVIESCTEVIEMQSGETKWTSGIREQIKKLANLTNNMVALAKMDEGIDMSMQDVNLSELVEEALYGFELEAEQQGRVIENNIEEGIIVKGNPTNLSELVSILADNALKYGSEDKPIKFSLEKQGKKVVLTQENYAEGLTKGSQNKFFDRFYRGDTSHSSDKPGSGIGLSMAQSIVNAHGGTISAESPDGKRLIITAKL